MSVSNSAHYTEERLISNHCSKSCASGNGIDSPRSLGMLCAPNPEEELIIPLDNMLPETAHMNLRWMLGQTDDPVKIREMMVTAVNHEITPHEPHYGYLILQGGLPEVEAFAKQHWK